MFADAYLREAIFFVFFFFSSFLFGGNVWRYQSLDLPCFVCGWGAREAVVGGSNCWLVVDRQSKKKTSFKGCFRRRCFECAVLRGLECPDSRDWDSHLPQREPRSPVWCERSRPIFSIVPMLRSSLSKQHQTLFFCEALHCWLVTVQELLHRTLKCWSTGRAAPLLTV